MNSHTYGNDSSRDETDPNPGLIEALVEIALDDIECGNLDTRGALRLIAMIAWREGRTAS